jgi:valyl-tRNA synthetase
VGPGAEDLEKELATLGFEQDPDVLDTWFSSALWPHGVLGWPEKTADLDAFYPTDLMITGRDILYLWVARMIMTGEEFLGKEPFREVMVHATVLTEDGKRMSKSLGTGVDPLELIRLYGADATRFGLTSLVTDNQDIRFKMLWKSGGKKAKGPDDALDRAEQIEQSRFFCNKLWNISRFVLLSLGEAPLRRASLELLKNGDCGPLQLSDRWILSRLASTVAAVNDAVDRYALGEASWALYHFVWDEFADWYVELAKPRLRAQEGGSVAEARLGINPQATRRRSAEADSGPDSESVSTDFGRVAQGLNPGQAPELQSAPLKQDPIREVLHTVLETTLRLAHPFLPFITEEIWQSLPGTAEGEALIHAGYPSAVPDLIDEAAEAEMERVMEITRAIRNLKAELRVPEKHVTVSIIGAERVKRTYIEQSARCTLSDARPEGGASTTLAGGCELAIAMAGLIDVEEEKAKTLRELEANQKELSGVQTKLNNEQFLSRAPAEIIEKQKAAQAALLEKRVKLEDRLRSLGKEHRS